MKGKYFADLFSGSGVGASAAVRSGFAARMWEKSRQPLKEDLTKRSVKSKLKRDIRRGKVLASMLAPPCRSFSTARMRTSVIRSAAQPWGRWTADLTERDRQDLTEGNQLANTCLSLMHDLFVAGVPFCLEHPSSSFLWKTFEVQQWMKKKNVYVVSLDQCQWQARWRKSTTLMFALVSPEDIEKFHRKCGGRGGWCPKHRRYHLRLEGHAPNGKSWTSIASEYPQSLARDIVNTLCAETLARQTYNS